MLQNFGGRMGVFGDLSAIARRLPETYVKTKHMVGIGSTMEAYSNSGIMYDLLAEMTWQDGELEISDFLRSYVHSRYGDCGGLPEQNALEGWNIIAQSALGEKTMYVQGPPEPVINALPTDKFVSASTWGHSTYQYKPEELERALLHFIKAY
jgi:hypothetical protein